MGFVGVVRIDELPSVLWSICTTPTKPTGETPFSLVYGAEAVLPSEITHGSPRVLAFKEAELGELRNNDLLLLEGLRRNTALRAARYQQDLCRYHSRHIRPRTLEAGDLVLRRILSRAGLRKLLPMWEGPYRVMHSVRPSSAQLEMEDGIPVANP